jgi:hypothetical protein
MINEVGLQIYYGFCLNTKERDFAVVVRITSTTYPTMLHSYLHSALLLSVCQTVVANPARDLKRCREYTLPVDVTSINYIWGLPQLQTNYDAATFNSKLGRWDANVTLNPISGGAQATASYKISGTFCAPSRGGNEIVLVATHGFGFDRRYERLQSI